MFEKVNPSHPDKIADRIAGAIVDLAYNKAKDPKVACEVLIGHKECTIINETSQHIKRAEVRAIVDRIIGKNISLHYVEVPQDKNLAENQEEGIRCGDNGIFKGVPLTKEENILTNVARTIYDSVPYDGKYIIDKNNIIICQSNVEDISHMPYISYLVGYNLTFNPLGFWTGGINVDCGATNRKLGSDMGRSVTGGGLHGKDLSKADVSVNIYCWLEAQRMGKSIEYSCAIGDDTIGYIPYSEIVEVAREYINNIGGFEKFAKWGLIR